MLGGDKRSAEGPSPSPPLHSFPLLSLTFDFLFQFGHRKLRTHGLDVEGRGLSECGDCGFRSPGGSQLPGRALELFSTCSGSALVVSQLLARMTSYPYLAPLLGPPLHLSLDRPLP